MFCKWCGLESETSDVCSWCNRPFSAAATAHQKPAPQPAVETAAADGAPVAATPIAQTPVVPAARAGAVPLGDFDDDLYDDFSPVPFAGRSTFSGKLAPAPPVPPVRPTAVPPAPPAAGPRVEAHPMPVPSPPPVSPGRGGPGYTPAAARQADDDRPQLEAIPIKRPGGAGSTPPAVIPIAKPTSPSVYDRPPSVAPSASPPPPSAPVIPDAPFIPAASPPAGAPPPANTLETPPVRRDAAPLGDRAEAPPVFAPAGENEVADLGLRPLTDVPEEDFETPPISIRRPLDSPSPSTTPKPAAPIHGRVATLVPGGGRTYYCRFCGMESETADYCSWCRRDMRSAPSVSAKGPAILSNRHGPAPKRGPVRQPVVPKTSAPVAPPKSAPSSNGSGHASAPPPAVPQLGTFTAQKSKYYSDKVMDPVSGAHYDADTGKTIEGEILPVEIEDVNEMRQLVMNSTFLIIMAGIAFFIARANPSIYLVLLGVTNFAAGIAMPLFRTVPFAEDDSEDLPWFLGLCIVLGPFVGAILYGFICMVRQNFSAGTIGVFISYLVLRISMDAATGHAFQTIMPFNEFTGETLGAQAMILVTLAGWYAAAPFHKPDES